MAGITFQVELDGEQAQAKLAAMVDRMARPIGFYKNVGEYMAKVSVRNNFLSERAPDGTPWASLRPITLARRQKAGHASTTILRASGKMASEINYQVTDQNVRIGSPAPQAAVMHFGAAQGAFGRTSRGGPIPWGNIPARPFLGLSEADETMILRIAEAWLEAE